jgi:hypothetical protein
MRMPKLSRPPRRGVALLLVLVVTGTAAGLGAMQLATGSAAPHVAANRERVAIGRHAALGTLEATAWLVAREESWRSSGGPLFTAAGIGGCLVSAEATDLQTGLAPGPLTRAVRLAAVAEIDGIRQKGEAILRTDRPADAAMVTCDLSEIAILARESIALEGRALVAMLPGSGLADLGDPLVVGTFDRRPDAIRVGPEANAVDVLALAPGDGDDLGRGHRGLPESLPFPLPPPHPALPAATATDVPGILPSLLTATVSSGNSIVVNGGRLFTVRGASRIATARDLSLASVNRFVVETPVEIVVGRDLTLDGVNFELFPNASITFHVLGRARIRNTPLGDDATLASGNGRIRIFGHGDASRGAWRLEGTARIAGEIYAPFARIEAVEAAKVVGRIAASSVLLAGDASLLFDPNLDRGNGLSVPDGPARLADGRLRAGLASLGSLSDESLAVAAASAGIALQRRGGTVFGAADPHASDRARKPGSRRLAIGDDR